MITNEIMVSVIIPFFSRIDWLEEAVNSVLNQTYKNFEIIVVNDGSPENDSSFVDKYGAKIKYYKIKNHGPGFARNFGIDKAIGKYIAFLDSDDLWMPQKLEKQINFMNSGSLIWSHTKYSTFDDAASASERVYTEIPNENFKGKIFPKCLATLHIATPCVMIQREYLHKNKLIRFAENMRFGQDGYMWILLGVENELGYINESLASVRMTGMNAVQKARVHLNVKANLNKNLIRKLETLYPTIQISEIIKITYNYCSGVNSFVDYIFGKRNFKKNRTAELISKIFYFPAYIILKSTVK